MFISIRSLESGGQKIYLFIY